MLFLIIMNWSRVEFTENELTTILFVETDAEGDER